MPLQNHSYSIFRLSMWWQHRNCAKSILHGLKKLINWAIISFKPTKSMSVSQNYGEISFDHHRNNQPPQGWQRGWQDWKYVQPTGMTPPRGRRNEGFFEGSCQGAVDQQNSWTEAEGCLDEEGVEGMERIAHPVQPISLTASGRSGTAWLSTVLQDKIYLQQLSKSTRWGLVALVTWPGAEDHCRSNQHKEH